MARLEIILILLSVVLFCGCGGKPATTPAPGGSASAIPTTTQSAIVPGNWQFTATATVLGEPPLTFAGSISQTGALVSSALHVDGSDCFDHSITIGLTGNATADNTSLTSSAVDGQVITLSGNFTTNSFDGTYRISGGCAGGEQGKMTGFNVWNIGNSLSGIFTNSTQKTFNVMATIAQSNSASSEGSFEITGTSTFDTPCFADGTIQPGEFPSGSFLLGTSVALEIVTKNGTLAFLGTMDQDGSGTVKGNYTVSGGGCDDSGTAILQVAGAWDY
jgi:hypothetical protein